MKVELLVTKSDQCLAAIEHELHELGVAYDVEYMEEHPELVSQHHVSLSPNVIINGQLAFRHQPTQAELMRYFAHQ